MHSPTAIRIDDFSDPRLKPYVDVRYRATSAAGKRIGDQAVGPAGPEGRFIAEGRLVVGRLLASDHAVESLLVESGLAAEFSQKVPADVPVFAMSRDRIRELVGFDFHRGVMACGRRRPLRPFDDFLGDSTRDRVTLGAMGVTEAANLGGMLRTAAAFGVRRVLLGPGTHDPLARRVIRTSMAAAFRMEFVSLDRPVGQLSELRRAGYRTLATTLADDATPIDFVSSSPERPVVLLMGNEARGLSDEVQAVASDRVKIPMRRGVDSLNVATAAAIFLYELSRDGARTTPPTVSGGR